MIKKLTSTIVKIPMLLAFLVVVATGCHTPEDLEEIGPQNPNIEANESPILPSLLQDKSIVSSLQHQFTSLKRNEIEGIISYQESFLNRGPATIRALFAVRKYKSNFEADLRNFAKISLFPIGLTHFKTINLEPGLII